MLIKPQYLVEKKIKYLTNPHSLKIFNSTSSINSMFKYFTVAEANEALPEVMIRFKEALRKRDIVESIERRMQETLASSSLSSDDHNVDGENNPRRHKRYANPLKAYMELKQEHNVAMTQMYHAISMLESIGVSLKGLESGMVDFPSKRFNNDVWLCWKAGETEIKFWHDMDSGFMGRKPLDVSDESLV